MQQILFFSNRKIFQKQKLTGKILRISFEARIRLIRQYAAVYHPIHLRTGLTVEIILN